MSVPCRVGWRGRRAFGQPGWPRLAVVKNLTGTSAWKRLYWEEEAALVVSAIKHNLQL